uniref:Uncharacterized protein n=1 Tax=viral metagenome TaxID=1070528 RepID=A0A6C0KEP4_9ZZZZ
MTKMNAFKKVTKCQTPICATRRDAPICRA